jgi:hypothetical protein
VCGCVWLCGDVAVPFGRVSRLTQRGTVQHGSCAAQLMFMCSTAHVQHSSYAHLQHSSCSHVQHGVCSTVAHVGAWLTARMVVRAGMAAVAAWLRWLRGCGGCVAAVAAWLVRSTTTTTRAKRSSSPTMRRSSRSLRIGGASPPTPHGSSTSRHLTSRRSLLPSCRWKERLSSHPTPPHPIPPHPISSHPIPSHHRWKERLGKCYYMLGLFREAEKQFASAIRTQPMVVSHLQLAKVGTTTPGPTTLPTSTTATAWAYAHTAVG